MAEDGGSPRRLAGRGRLSFAGKWVGELLKGLPGPGGLYDMIPREKSGDRYFMYVRNGLRAG